eukprot:5229577-Pleurochrysis_carterae.AAC.1
MPSMIRVELLLFFAVSGRRLWPLERSGKNLVRMRQAEEDLMTARIAVCAELGLMRVLARAHRLTRAGDKIGSVTLHPLACALSGCALSVSKPGLCPCLSLDFCLRTIIFNSVGDTAIATGAPLKVAQNLPVQSLRFPFHQHEYSPLSHESASASTCHVCRVKLRCHSPTYTYSCAILTHYLGHCRAPLHVLSVDLGSLIAADHTERINGRAEAV